MISSIQRDLSSVRARNLFAAAFVVLLASCSPTESARLVGTWNIENAQSVSKKVGSEASDAASELESATPEQMTVEFSRGGRLATKTQMGSIDSAKSGSWKFLSYDEDAGKMQIECSLLGQTTQHEVEFVDTKTIKWIPPNMAGTTRRLKFVRGN